MMQDSPLPATAQVASQQVMLISELQYDWLMFDDVLIAIVFLFVICYSEPWTFYNSNQYRNPLYLLYPVGILFGSIVQQGI